MIIRHRARQQGFSLIEVLIALLILGGGLLGLARMQMGMLGGTAESVLNDNAIRLAEEKLESLRFELAAGQELAAGNDEPQMNGVRMQRSWSLSALGDGLVATEVTVQWEVSTTGEVQTLQLPARLIRPDLAAQGWLLQNGQPTRETLP